MRAAANAAAAIRCKRHAESPPSKTATRELNFDALNSVLESLERIDERAHRVVEMRYFGGMEIEEIARFLRYLTGDGQARLDQGALVPPASTGNEGESP